MCHRTNPPPAPQPPPQTSSFLSLFKDNDGPRCLISLTQQSSLALPNMSPTCSSISTSTNCIIPSLFSTNHTLWHGTASSQRAQHQHPRQTASFSPSSLLYALAQAASSPPRASGATGQACRIISAPSSSTMLPPARHQSRGYSVSHCWPCALEDGTL